MPNYVKFQRGSKTAYETVLAAPKESTSSFYDTLYFVYDSTNKAAGGSLFLGDILIGSTGSSSENLKISGLSDVDLENLDSGSLLQYNNLQEKWEAISVDDLKINSTVKIGQTNENETVAEAQTRLISSPSEGDIVVINGDAYIYNNDAGWVSLKSEDLTNKITTLETRVGDLETQFSNVNHLTYSVVGSLNDIDEAISNNNPDLNRTIFLVPNSTGVLDDSYDEYMVVTKNDTTTKERLGSLNTPSMSGYVTTQTFDQAVGSLQDQLDAIPNNYVNISTFNSKVGGLKTNIDNLTEEIIDLKASIEWHNIST